jgi:hypothetical protein
LEASGVDSRPNSEDDLDRFAESHFVGKQRVRPVDEEFNAFELEREWALARRIGGQQRIQTGDTDIPVLLRQQDEE